MHVADDRVLAPEHDVPAVEQVEVVVAVTRAEILDLGGLTGARTDVTNLASARPELIEEQVGQVLEDAERTSGPVVEDRSRS